MSNTSVVSPKALAAGIAVTVGTSVVVYLYYKRKIKDRVPTEWTVVGKVENLFMYPLKSGKRIELTEAECTNKGFTEIPKFSGSFGLRDR